MDCNPLDKYPTPKVLLSSSLFWLTGLEVTEVTESMVPASVHLLVMALCWITAT